MREYAILPLSSLQAKRYGTLDELKGAIADFQRAGTPFLVFKWNKLGESWAQMEVME